MEDTAVPAFVGESDIENLVTCTGKTEITKEQLLHSRKSDGNDSSYNSYETSDSKFIACRNLAKTCLLVALYIHCVLAL